jgi:hypothetical protein
MWLAAVVCTPWVANRSFMPIGTPAILPSGLPAARSASTAAAASSAFSGVVDDEGVFGNGSVERGGDFGGGKFTVNHAFADGGDAEIGKPGHFQILERRRGCFDKLSTSGN